MPLVQLFPAIGGASGVCGNKIYFLGNIDLHPDGQKIREYVSTHGYDVVCLSDEQLSDFGGIKFVKNAGYLHQTIPLL